MVVGVALGLVLAPQLKGRPMPQWVAKIPVAGALTQPDKDSPFEMYDYPTIKWRPKPVADHPGAIVQLWTTFDHGDDPASTDGRIKYRLTMFKAPEKTSCEVQLLDKMGFKVMQFDASDFHQIPGAADIMEARDSQNCKESYYKKVEDYSIK